MSYRQMVLAAASSLALALPTLSLGNDSALAAGSGSPERYAPLSTEELDSIVAPIALYPDSLVARVLGAATYPDQIVAANQFVKVNGDLKGDALRAQVENRGWDPAVQALTQFPSVLEQLARNISWTSALGDATANQEADVMAAVQRMRARAYSGGTLTSGPEIKVIQQSPQVIVIEPAKPNVIYVPRYNPTVVYGAPVVVPAYNSDVVAALIDHIRGRSRDRRGGGRLMRVWHELEHGVDHELHVLRRDEVLRQPLLEGRLLSRVLPGVSPALLLSPPATTLLPGVSSWKQSPETNASHRETARSTRCRSARNSRNSTGRRWRHAPWRPKPVARDAGRATPKRAKPAALERWRRRTSRRSRYLTGNWRRCASNRLATAPEWWRLAPGNTDSNAG